MNKSEFLKKLAEKLSGLSDFDAQERINFYSEMIDDKIEEGLSEEEAIASIGSADTIASEVLEEMVIEEMTKDEPSEISEKKPEKPTAKAVLQTAKGKLTVGQIVLLALGSPIWISLAAAAFAVVLSLWVVLWSVVISLWAATVGLAVGGVGGIALGIVSLCLKGTVGALIIACAFAACGLAILFYLASMALTKASALLTVNIALAVKRLFTKNKEEKK